MINEENQLINEMDRARQAQDIVEHPLYQEAVETYRHRLMDEWVASPARDQEGREKIWLMIKTAEAVERHLKEIMETGKLATIQMDRRKKGWFGKN